MNANETMAIEWACQKLSAEYVRHADFQDFEAFADLFTSDGVLALFGEERIGRDGIIAPFLKRPQMVTRHLCSDHCINVIDADHAEGTVYLTLYRVVGNHTEDDGPIPYQQPTLIGHYADTYKRTDKGWKFATRTLHVRFQSES